MKPRTLFILLFILAVCGVIVGLSSTGLLESKPPAPLARKVFASPVTTPSMLTIRDSRGVELVFHREAESWEMVSPMRAAIKKERLTKIIRTMNGLEYSRVFSPAGDEGLGDSLTGLDRPIWTVVLAGPGQTSTLLVGKSAAKLGIGRQETFVRPGGAKKTFVVAMDISAMLAGGAEDYRDMTVLKLDPKFLSAVEVHGRQNYTLRKTDDKWRIVSPLSAACDPAKVGQWIKKLATIRAERFLVAVAPADLAALGLDKPQLVIELIGKSRAVLKLGNRRGLSVTASINDGAVFTLPAAMLDQLQPPLDELRTKILLPFKPAEVEKIIIERSQTKTVLIKISTGWKMTVPQPGDVDSAAINKLLDSLSNLRAKRWIYSPDGKDITIARPAAVVALTVKRPDKVRTFVLRIGGTSDDGKSVYCRSSTSETVAAVAAGSIELVMQSPEKFRLASPTSKPSPATRPRKK